MGSHPVDLPLASASPEAKSDEKDEKEDGGRSGTSGAAGGTVTASGTELPISSATRFSAAMITEGSGPSPTGDVERIRAPAVAASE
jgi:hypothetical protein